MQKLITISTVLLTTFIATTPSFAAPHKKDPCLKQNNGIGNNHDIYVELPTNSQTLTDPDNAIISIRIDPGNLGQVKKFKGSLTDGTVEIADGEYLATNLDPAEVNFVVAQLIDAEKKVR